MTPLEREYRFLIRRELRKGDKLEAIKIRDWGTEHFGLDLTDIAIEP